MAIAPNTNMCKMTGVPLTIRPFLPADGPAVEHILCESPQASPWSAESLQRFSGDEATSGGLFLVSESQGQISGFILARHVVDEAEILNLAVLSAYRRRGQASSLLAAALAVFQDPGVLRIFLEVRESNSSAISFYKKHSFEVIGLRPGYYHDPDEAALRMMRRLPPLGTRTNVPFVSS
jgi:[ribosomal protein S18]-alanine N-acetyltransferase